MNELQTFNFNQHQVRTSLINNEPYFCLKDVCEVLEITNPSQLKTRLKDPGVSTNEVGVVTGTKADGTPAYQQIKMTFINESNLYRVIFQSRKDEAIRFQDWVTDEVLPTIRRTGGYKLPSYAETLRLYANAVEEREKLLIENKELKPKADFFDTVANSKTAIPMEQVAKVVGIKGLGRNNLFEFLRNKKILQSNNIPYQKYVDCGYFRVVESKFVKSNGATCINIKTLVYQKGVDFIIKLIEREDN